MVKDNKNKLAACVILYNPDQSVVTNIETYIKHIDVLYVIDNKYGEIVTTTLKNKYSNIIVKKYDNYGLAYPYNKVLEEIKNKFKFLLLMDQDSSFNYDNIEKFRNFIDIMNWEGVLALGCTLIDINKSFCNSNINIKTRKVDKIINSGTIVNVKLAEEIGGWNEDLFIDAVDDEFCYRGRIKGYKILQCNESICLKHVIGTPIKRKIFFKTYSSMNHNYIRKYYMIRNGLYVWKKYHFLNNKKFFKDYLKANWNMIVEIILIEKDKFRKLKYCYLGIRDFFNSKMGKFEA